jgi:hypothetical protein
MKTKSKRRSFWLPLVVLALVVALALGGCARGAQNSGVPGNPTTSSSSQTPGAGNPGGSSTNDELNHLQQIDQQNQNDANGLNNDGQNANQNTGNDQETQP